MSTETLRLHPPFTLISKECTSDVRLELTKGKSILIERGTNVYIPLYQLQNDPEYFPKPKEFIPERCSQYFSSDGIYLPFGSGTRQCLGMKFASMVCKAAVVDIVKNFKITVNSRTSEELRINPNEFLNIKEGGLWINFKPVKMFQI
jgi:cytochrome P450